MMCGSAATGDSGSSNNNDLNDTYQLKYQLLSKRCREIEQDSERLVNLIYQTYKLYVKGTKRKAILMKKLDSFEDSFRTADRSEYIEVKKEHPNVKATIKSESTNDASPKSVQGSKCNSSSHLPPNGSIAPSSKPTSSKKAKNSSNSASCSMTNGHHPSSSGICSSTSTSSSSTSSSATSPSSSTICSSTGTPELAPVPPKKPINPYLLFCQMNRSTIQEQLHNENKTDQVASKQELTKALATKWKDLAIEDKNRYYKLYELEKEKYDKALKLFNASHSQSVMNTCSSSSNTPNAPSNSSTKHQQHQQHQQFCKSNAPLTLSSTFSSPIATALSSKVASSLNVANSLPGKLPSVLTSRMVTVSSSSPSSLTSSLTSSSPSPSASSSSSSSASATSNSAVTTVTSIVVTDSSTISTLKQQHLATIGKSHLSPSVSQSIIHVVPPSTTITAISPVVNNDTSQPCIGKVVNNIPTGNIGGNKNSLAINSSTITSGNTSLASVATAPTNVNSNSSCANVPGGASGGITGTLNGSSINGIAYTISNCVNSSNLITAGPIIHNGLNKSIDVSGNRK